MKKHMVCTNCLPGRNGTCENTSNESGEDVNISANSAAAEEKMVRKPTKGGNNAPIQESPRLVKSALNRTCPLPPVVTMASPTFTWGTLTSDQVTRYFSDAYLELVHWRRNVFFFHSLRKGSIHN